MNTKENVVWVEMARLPVAKMQDVLLARFIGRDEATRMGFPPEVLTRLATVISEITRNVIQHAGCAGEFQMGRLQDGERQGLRIVVSDKGRGLEHPEQYMSSANVGAAGAGLSGSRRLVDCFHIQSAPGAGTTVTMDVWQRLTPA